MPRFLRQFGLRTLLLFCTLAAVCFGLWRWHMTWTDRQHELAAQVADRWADVRWKTWGPTWLHETFGSRYFSYIVVVDWHHKQIKDEDLWLLKEISTLEELYVAGTPITDEGMAVLDHLPRIKRLAIWSTRLTDKSLEHVGKLRNLEVVDFHRTPMTEKGLVHLRGLPNVTLVRQSMVLSDEGIDHLASIPHAQIESLHGKDLSYASMQWVAKQSLLQAVQLERPVGDQWGDCLAGMTAMKTLSISDAQMNDEQLTAILHDSRLLNLSLSQVPITDAALVWKPNTNWPSRKSLRNTLITPEGLLTRFGPGVSQLEISDSCLMLGNRGSSVSTEWVGTFESEDWKHLVHSPDVQRLVVGLSLSPSDNVEALRSLKQLQNVAFHNTASDAALAALADLPQLSSIVMVDRQQVTAEGFRQLKRLRAPLGLGLYIEGITDEQLSGIGDVTQLTSLSMPLCRLTDQGMSHLTKLVNLESLLVTSSPKALTEEALRPIGKLPKLSTLRFQGVKIGDEGLKHLHNMPALRNVDLFGATYSTEGMKALTDSLPSYRRKSRVYWDAPHIYPSIVN